MKKTYTLYEHVFPNGKRYIGVTSQNLKVRWQNGFGYDTQSKVFNAIQKYGWDNIQHNILKSGLTEEEAQELERKTIIELNTIENGYNVLVGGIKTSGEKLYEYNGELLTASELGKKYGIDGHTITSRLEKKWDINRAINQEIKPRPKVYKFEGKEYTFDEIYSMLKTKLTKEEVMSRIYHKWDLNRIISQPSGTKKQPFGIKEPTYEYNGKLYNSYQLVQLSPYDLTIGDITNRINNHHWSVEKTINTPKKERDKKIEYNGKLYSTKELAELNADPKVTHHTVTDRLNYKWTVEDIIKIPSGMTRKQFYKNK